MSEILQGSIFFGLALTLLTYLLGVRLQKRTKTPLCNPLIIATLLIVAVLILFNIPTETYNDGAKYVSFLLTPATVSLAVPLYEQLQVLKKNYGAILIGIFTGALTALVCVFLLALVFRLDHFGYVTALPKSITTAIGSPLAEEMGGSGALTALIIVFTGTFGNMIAPYACRWFRITDPVAKGVAIGTASHAIGTARALEMGEIEGAVSGLSIAVAGLMTVALAPLFSGLI